MSFDSEPWSVPRRWSQAEVNRTIEEIRRRALTDLEFRNLALTSPIAAVARVNPKPLPSRLRLRFVEPGSPEAVADEPGNPTVLVPLPSLVPASHQLSEAELEQAVGGTAEIHFPLSED